MSYRYHENQEMITLNQELDEDDEDDVDDSENYSLDDDDEDYDYYDEEFQNHPLLRDHYRNGLLKTGKNTANLDLIAPTEDHYYQRYSNAAPSDGSQENGDRTGAIRINMPPPRRKKKFPSEIRKTIGAALFMFLNFVATTASLSIIHEQRPMYDPLPDQILDRIKLQPWALDASEILLQIMCVTSILIVIFHKYRMIVCRRIFFILGLLYGYRAITMFVTILPSANPAYHCAPKLMDSGRQLTVNEVFRRVFKILSGFGLTINGQHVYCGDFIFSGHTMIAISCYLIITEYTNKRWFLLHWVVWVVAMGAVVMLLLSRGHYSIDVIIAYYITTRLFWLYHSMAYHESLKKNESVNRFSKIWWWRMLVYFESNVHSGPIPNTFSWPIKSSTIKHFGRLFSSFITNCSIKSTVGKHIQSTFNDIKSKNTNTSS